MGQRILGSGMQAIILVTISRLMVSQQAHGHNDIQEFHLPNKNDFIPTNLDVEKREVSEVRFFCVRDELLLTPYQKPQRRPHLIYETELSQVWYKKDDQFWLPKASVVIEIRRLSQYYSNSVVDTNCLHPVPLQMIPLVLAC